MVSSCQHVSGWRLLTNRDFQRAGQNTTEATRPRRDGAGASPQLTARVARSTSPLEALLGGGRYRHVQATATGNGGKAPLWIGCCGTSKVQDDHAITGFR